MAQCVFKPVPPPLILFPKCDGRLSFDCPNNHCEPVNLGTSTFQVRGIFGVDMGRAKSRDTTIPDRLNLEYDDNLER